MAKLKVSESQIQKTIITFLNTRRILHNRINNGQFVLDGSGTDKYGRQRRVSKSRAVRCNSLNGIPDLELFYSLVDSNNNPVLQFNVYLEVKTETGRQSKNQKVFQSKISNNGGYYYIVRNIEDVVNALTNVSETIKEKFNNTLKAIPVKALTVAEKAKN